jgi:TolB-like protein/DNA-binding SARP family transcriptional activator
VLAKSSTQISLRLLGGASVVGPNGLINARGTRAHRLALLAVLSTGKRRPISRDKLIALLWPDASEDRARPLLSDALYLLRGALGEEAILGVGDDVQINAELVDSDEQRFEQLVAAREFEPAVAEYTGPLLDGFHLNDGGAEFEQWLDGERARLDAMFADALGAAAAVQEQAERWAAALPHLRRLAAHDPYSGQSALRLMRTLQRSGNRAGALQHARVHSALLRDEFGTEPDAAVTAFVAQLMDDATTRSPHAAPESPAGVAPAEAGLDAAHDTAPYSAPPTTDLSTFAARVAAPAPHVSHVAAGVAAPAPDVDHHDAPAASRATTAAPEVRPQFPGRSVLLVMALAAMAVTGVVIARREPATDARATATSPARGAPLRSIAVLPFDDLSAAQDDAWFGDGLTEEIIGVLGRVDGLRVAARRSSFAFRRTPLDARSIGDTLHVATLLEGSVRRDGDQMRVTARLVDAASGYQLWSRSYDRRARDVIALQNEIANAIVGALQLRLAPARAATVARAPDDPDVYDLFLRAVYARNKLTRDELLKAVDYFDRAIRLDSAYAPAYAAQVTTLGPMIWYGYLPRAQGVALMRAATARAISLDASLPEAHIAQGMLAFYFDWNWALGEQSFRRAIELNPNEAIAYHFLANLLRSTGRFDEAIAARLRSIELDPLSVRTIMQLGTDYFLAGRTAEAAAQFRRAKELEPRSPALVGQGPTVSLGLGHVYERDGMFRAALTEYVALDSLNGVAPAGLADLRQAFERSGIRGYWRMRGEQLQRTTPPTDLVHQAWVWARVGDTGKTVQLLEEAYRARNPGLVFLAVHPDFAAARKDARVRSLMASLGLAAVPR